MAEVQDTPEAPAPEPTVAERVAAMQAEHADRSKVTAAEHLNAAQHGRLIGGAVPSAPPDAQSPGQQAVDVAAASPQHAKQMNEEQKMDALTWLLQDTADDDALVTQDWQFNIGSEDNPVWIEWSIKPLDADMMNQLRQQARSEAGVNRRTRRAGGEADFDVTTFNLRMVAAATVSPDLQQAAEMKGLAAADPLYGPVRLLKLRFERKPGVVDQIAGKVMLLSGYDEEDVRRATPEVAMVRAAGNS